MQINQRKNRVDLTPGERPVVMPEVHASLDVHARHRDPRPILNALATMQGRLGQQAVQQRERKDTENTAKGRRDALLGDYDEELAADSEAYRSGHATLRAHADGLEWFHTKVTELSEKVTEDPDFFMEHGEERYNAYKQEIMQEYLQGREDPHAIAAATNMANRVLEAIDSRYYATRAKLKVAEAENEIGRAFLAAHRAQAIRSIDDVKQLIAMGGDLVGIDEQDALEIGLKALLPDIQSGQVELADHFAELVQDNPELRESLMKAKEQGENRLRIEEERRRREMIEADMATWSWAYGAIEQGTFGASDARRLQDMGYITGKEGARMLAQSAAARQRMYEATRKEREEAERKAQLLQWAISGDVMGIDPSGGTEVINESFQSAMQQLVQARNSEDPAAMEQAAQALNSSIWLAQNNGVIPKGLNNILSDVDFSTPERVARTMEFYEAMRDLGREDYLKQHLDSTTHARLTMLTRMRDEGRSAEQIAEQFQRVNPVSREDAASRAQRHRRDIEEIARDFAGKSKYAFGPAYNTVEEMLIDNIVLGADPKEALGRIEKELPNRLKKVGDGVIPGHVSTGPGLENTISMWLKQAVYDKEMVNRPGTFDDPRELMATPIPNQPGSFIVTTPWGVYLDENGESLIVTAEEMHAQLAALQSKRLQGQRDVNEGLTDREKKSREYMMRPAIEAFEAARQRQEREEALRNNPRNAMRHYLLDD